MPGQFFTTHCRLCKQLWRRFWHLYAAHQIRCRPLQAAKEKDHWKEMSDASLERIRTTYTWCAHLPSLFQDGIKSATPSA